MKKDNLKGIKAMEQNKFLQRTLVTVFLKLESY